LFTDDLERNWPKCNEGEIILRSKFPKKLVNEGTYRLDCIAGLHNQQHIYQSNINSASIELTIKGGLSESPYWIMKRPGVVAPILKWERFIESKKERE
jgi:lipopolysaccharide transport system ATP-binding protein